MTRSRRPSTPLGPLGLTRRSWIAALPLGLAASAAGLTLSGALGGRRGAADAAGGTGRLRLDRGGAWLNSPPLTPEALRGRVVLVNFWTYTCINSLRPLPYLRRWAERYADRGLTVVGVHSPEFSFEHELPRVQRAVQDLDVRFPVVLDNQLATWRAFGNTAWPGFYFIDAHGRVRRRIVGEGGYDAAERFLQTLLSEAGGRRVDDLILPASGSGPQAPADWVNIRSGETYAGHARATGFASPGGLRRDQVADYRPPADLPLNSWSLEGRWRVASEAATLSRPDGAIAFRFHARDLHLVMAPPAAGPLRFRIRLDGADPGAHCGHDVDQQGWGRLDAARMYQLVRQAGPVTARTFEVVFDRPGASAYAFTFG